MRFSPAKSLLTASLVAAAIASTASGAVINLNEIGLDAIYGQASIDIRYNPAQTIYNTALLSIDTDEEFNSLSTYETGGLTLSMFFVDSINFCGVALANIVGCGSTPGTLIALDSGFIANDAAAVTAMGHEIGHNLGLGHELPDNGTNLMNPTTFTFNINSLPPLTPAQITAIFLSPLVQGPQGGKFIQITPFLVADSVPEPSTLSLLGLALGVAIWKKRSARTAA